MKGPLKTSQGGPARENPGTRTHDQGSSDARLHPHRNREGSDGGDKPRRLSGSTAVAHAKAHLVDLTGRPCEAVSALSRTRDGWRIVLEVLELERIPRTTDILASYEVELDQAGDLMSYERIHRYYRNDVGGDQ